MHGCIAVVRLRRLILRMAAGEDSFKIERHGRSVYSVTEDPRLPENHIRECGKALGVVRIARHVHGETIPGPIHATWV
jgi:hypothetical protein